MVVLYFFSEDEGSVHTSSLSSEHSDDVESQTASTNKVCTSLHSLANVSIVWSLQNKVHNFTNQIGSL